MSNTISTAALLVGADTALASGHLVVLSVRTKKYFFFVFVLGSGAIKSIAILKNGMSMIDNGCSGAIRFLSIGSDKIRYGLDKARANL